MIKEDIPSIDEVREEIRKIDDEIIQLIADRVKLAEKVLMAKKKNNLDINDERQNEIVLKRVEDLAVKNDLDVSLVKDIFEKLIEMNIKKQYELLNKIK